ncbi:AlpA family transcriptional regulator [Gemmobacter caeni]|uniref:AlpA family transcriptional regulator n=1 Tax=Gemmobacter caeni TaxID=589035 RepID=A0A2T6A3J2_9RHOB|nr:AlpA family phage regulatory protein [Gemmobacter caeni]PTX38381.1 AlpA family transcriptional regulator [Gemmobacter caeni]TWI89804.1 AlpA family transcriptional regulator [Gemmobacter caeni]
MEPNDPNRLLRAKQVAEMTGLSVSTFYAQIRRGEFPKPLQLSPNAVAWRYGDIVGWINSLQEAAR